MSEAPAHPSRALSWTLVILGVVLLYVLSNAWVFVLFQHYYFPRTPTWMEVYTTPYFWLRENTPLRLPLVSYENWCAHLAELEHHPIIPPSAP